MAARGNRVQEEAKWAANWISQIKKKRLPPSRWNIRSSGMLRSVSGSYRRFGTTYRPIFKSLKLGPIGRPKTSVAELPFHPARHPTRAGISKNLRFVIFGRGGHYDSSGPDVKNLTTHRFCQTHYNVARFVETFGDMNIYVITRQDSIVPHTGLAHKALCRHR
jgi:hypothetical protein